MHKDLEDITDRIIDVAIGALSQANRLATFGGPGTYHWDKIAVLNAATAGELFLKAIITKEHPLLIFRDLFHLEDSTNNDLTIEYILDKGKTYNFEHLPKLLWVATGDRIPDLENFEKLRKNRNSIQHFCKPLNADLQTLSLEFIYKNIDPLINKHLDLCAIEFNDDEDVGMDYLVGRLIQNELFFSIPDDFKVTEIDLEESISSTSDSYQKEIRKRFSEKNIKF